MRGVFALCVHVDLLLFVRPAIHVGDQLVRTRRKIHSKRRAAARFSVYKNLRAAGFAGDICDRANEREGSTGSLATLHFDVTAHFPTAAAGDDRIFAGGKIVYRLRRHAVAGNPTVVACYPKLRAGRLGLELKRAFTPHELKW